MSLASEVVQTLTEPSADSVTLNFWGPEALHPSSLRICTMLSCPVPPITVGVTPWSKLPLAHRLSSKCQSLDLQHLRPWKTFPDSQSSDPLMVAPIISPFSILTTPQTLSYKALGFMKPLVVPFLVTIKFSESSTE